MASPSCTSSDLNAISTNSVTLGECLLVASSGSLYPSGAAVDFCLEIAGVSPDCGLCCSNYFNDANDCTNTVCGLTRSDAGLLSTACVECLVGVGAKYGDSSICGIKVMSSPTEEFDKILNEIQQIIGRAKNSSNDSNAAVTGSPSISIKQFVFILGMSAVFAAFN